MIAMDVKGLRALDKQLKALPDKVLFRVVRPATSKAMTPVLQSARNNAKAIKDTGLLAKSLWRKGKTYRRKGTVIHVIGPRAGFKQEVTRTFKTKDGRVIKKKEMANPANYAHLVELGTKPHSLGEGGGQHPGAQAKPFLRPAFDSNEDRILAIYRTELAIGVVREALKLKNKA